MSRQPQRTSRLAVAALVCACTPFLLVGPVAGIVLGIIAVRAIKRDDRLKGRDIALAAIMLAGLILVGSCIFLAILSQWRD
jgi:hypothetical protein